MLMQAKNSVGFNTPGAASSAADLEAQDLPKSRPKPEKNVQDGPKVPKKCIRSVQERKKGAQERKKCQHGPNLKNFGQGLGSPVASPSISMQGGSKHISMQ